MKKPHSDLQATEDERAKQPDFDPIPAEELVRGERTRDDFFDAVLTLDSPRTVSEVADRAGHGVDAAREYLEWFERMGIVTQVGQFQRRRSDRLTRRNEQRTGWVSSWAHSRGVSIPRKK